MKAVAKMRPGIGNVEYVEFPTPKPFPNQALIEVKAAGICGTDLHIFKDEFPSVPPVILGHEFSGVVTEIGKSVKHINPGDRVVAELYVNPCGICHYCKTGYINLCLKRSGLGWSANGSFAKFIVVDENFLHVIPENLDFYEGAVIEPLAVSCLGVIESTRVKAGDVIYVTGPGPIGLITAQVAMAEGGLVVIGGIGSDQSRLNIAKQLGIPHIINIEEINPIEYVKDLTKGLGADIIFECSGSEPAVNQCLEVIRKAGKFTQMGLFGKPISINMDRIVMKQIQFQGVFSSNWASWDRALRLIERKNINLQSIITHKFPLSDWRKAFDLLWNKEGLKVLLLPEE